MTSAEFARNGAQAPFDPAVLVSAPLPVRESHSSISTYRCCPLRYGFRYVDRRPVEVPPTWYGFGSAVHQAFELFVRARIKARVDGVPGPGAEVLQAAFNAAVSDSGLPPDEAASARVRGVPALARFLEREATNPADPVAVELGFEVDIGRACGDRLRFCGYVDRVDLAPDGSIEVLDYKTGRSWSQADVDADEQLTAYSWAIARGGLRDPANGNTLAPAARLGIYFADQGSLAWTTRSAARLERFEADLLETVARIRGREFRANPAPSRCRWCEYRAVCPAADPGA